MYHSVGLLLVIAHLHAVLGETEKWKNTTSRENLQTTVRRTAIEWINKDKSLKFKKKKEIMENTQKKEHQPLQSVWYINMYT